MTSKPPFFPQERYDTCALACLRMILAFNGIETSEEELVLATKMEEGGVDIEELAQVARYHGLKAEIRKLEEASLLDFIAIHRWAIVFLNRFPLDRQFAIHSVIPIRFTPHFVTVLDPLKGERRISRRKFDQARRYLDRYGVICYLE
jgi:ABC-type bacteriocin/lantibiotic exporter with double-glycine peptidase domain